MGTLLCHITSVVASLGANFFWMLPQNHPDLSGKQFVLEPLSLDHVLGHTLGGWIQITYLTNMYGRHCKN